MLSLSGSIGMQTDQWADRQTATEVEKQMMEKDFGFSPVQILKRKMS